MSGHQVGWIAWCLVLGCVGPATAQEVTRREVLATARAYQMLAWIPTSRNVFHGVDPDHVRVDTPDQSLHRPGTRPGWWVPGQANVGVPYMWGGFSSLEEFMAGIKAGKAAGDVYTAEKRAKLDSAVSKECVGIDCSGLVSRCWKLPRSYSTRELPSLCVPLASYDDLQPGDILNTENSHVLLFESWKDRTHQRLYAYEAGSPPSWKVLLDDVPVQLLRGQNYKPYRYRQIRG